MSKSRIDLDDNVATPGDAAAYDAWYDTPRGRWIGEREFRLAQCLLAPQPGETLLDVGCGTGWFTRRFAATGLRPDGSGSECRLAGLCAQPQHRKHYLAGGRCPPPAIPGRTF